MNHYNTIEKELAHVRGAIQILGQKLDRFPRDTVIGSPAYWRARICAIRDRAERNNYRKLKNHADELLDLVEKLKVGLARNSDGKCNLSGTFGPAI
ncbi:hypothetical protein [Burkholderia stagnalis]|uniref:hypothetical protein n=1 Tax=Burkholderia stagnalis TaxID=1503054 RepID=UPI000F5638CF|nr:hypothetical protein [Burkholderia stagnalis]